MSNILLTKLLLGPGLVVAASLAGRRWGPAISGILVAIPIVLGPTLLIITIEHGEEFGAEAATSSLLAMVALAVYVVAFERAAHSFRWEIALAIGGAVFFALAVALSEISAAPVVALLAATTAFTLALRAIPPPPAPIGPPTPPPGWDLPARAVATAILILVLTGFAGGLGPALAGALAPFPVAMTVVAGFVLAQDGAPAATDFLRGFLRAAFGIVAFCFLLALLIESLGTGAAFATALAGGLAAEFAVVRAARSLAH